MFAAGPLEFQVAGLARFVALAGTEHLLEQRGGGRGDLGGAEGGGGGHGALAGRGAVGGEEAVGEVRRSPVGFCVSPAVPYQWEAAITLRKWQVLERLGYVRLTAEPDPYWEPDCDCGDPKCPSNDPASEAFGSVGEYRLDPDAGDDEGWEAADSVWGHVGYRDVLDWRENVYVLDVMDATIAAFRNARKAATAGGAR